jgi:hypothetical protein
MPQIAKTSLILSLALLALAGCGDVNKDATFDSAISRHPAGWLPDGHKAAASAKIESCTECHGSDFSGGIAKVACTQCHLGDETDVHPLTWGDFAYVQHPAYIAQNGTAACANAFCHGTSLTGVAASGPSCTSCHIGGQNAVHPWTVFNDFSAGRLPKHAQFATATGAIVTASCRNVVCHGANLQGVLASGPPCSACHFGVTFP